MIGRGGYKNDQDFHAQMGCAYESKVSICLFELRGPFADFCWTFLLHKRCHSLCVSYGGKISKTGQNRSMEFLHPPPSRQRWGVIVLTSSVWQ